MGGLPDGYLSFLSFDMHVRKQGEKERAREIEREDGGGGGRYHRISSHIRRTKPVQARKEGRWVGGWVLVVMGIGTG